ncbi:MAG: hypothetical protein AMJ59_01615 [Gammaproteobacteria bacterium SG8_31]|jgi:hypothetical protein|nr:MAG: hypothetical protein AMJ59_01615 [Gammaproteobacteria bacterium SG8_31]
MSSLSDSKVDIEATNHRLKTLELEWRERKAERVLQALDDAIVQLENRFAGYTAVTVEKGERAIFVRIGEDRELKLHVKLAFDERGLMRQSFILRDRQVRRRPAYEELEKDYTFDTLDKAIACIVRACD